MADTPLLVVFPRGQLSADDKAQMREVGIIAVEADDPKAVAQLHLTQPLITSNVSGDAVVLAALGALCSEPTKTSGGSITGVGRAMVKFTKEFRAALERSAAGGVSVLRQHTKSQHTPMVGNEGDGSSIGRVEKE